MDARQVWSARNINDVGWLRASASYNCIIKLYKLFIGTEFPWVAKPKRHQDYLVLLSASITLIMMENLLEKLHRITSKFSTVHNKRY